MKKRELCGIYFRVKRDGKYENICFTDMTEEEQRKLLDDDLLLSEEDLCNLCLRLAQVVRNLGDMFDISAEKGEEQ